MAAAALTPTPVSPTPVSPTPVAPGNPAPTPVAPATGNTAPKIAGTAPATITAGENYSFKPEASDSDQGDTVSFTIANKPTWATFDSATGQLAGKPEQAHVGKYEGIEIAATDGDAVTPLPQFSVTVNSGGAQGAPKTVTLAWEPPTANEDGTALTDLKGYTIHYGTASQAYSAEIPVNTAGVTEYVVADLPQGTYYFALTATNVQGDRSGFSEEVVATLN